jgi:hypothetical protein
MFLISNIADDLAANQSIATTLIDPTAMTNAATDAMTRAPRASVTLNATCITATETTQNAQNARLNIVL